MFGTIFGLQNGGDWNNNNINILKHFTHIFQPLYTPYTLPVDSGHILVTRASRQYQLQQPHSVNH